MSSKLLKLIPVLLVALLYSGTALAGEGTEATDWQGLAGLGAGLAMGFAALGSGLGQGLLAKGALEGMARNPQAAGRLQISMLLALAFPESLVLFTLVIAYMLQAKF